MEKKLEVQFLPVNFKQMNLNYFLLSPLYTCDKPL